MRIASIWASAVSTANRRSGALNRVTPVLCLLGLLLAVPASAERRVHFEDPFDAAERHMLTAWIDEAAQGVSRLVGDFPFDVDVHVYRRDHASQPVPWGHTRRGPNQAIHLYVDPRFGAEDFRQDWTAPHEFSHLILPYLGSEHAWFAEGFASYMQYQVLMAMGVLTPAQAEQRYQERIGRAQARYDSEDPLVTAAPRLVAERNYPTMYWGGAVFFLRADALLKEHGHAGLISLLREYLACCRSRYDEPAAVVARLDQLSESTRLMTLLQDFERTPGFPQWSGSLQLAQ